MDFKEDTGRQALFTSRNTPGRCYYTTTTPSRLDIHNFEQFRQYTENIANSELPPKQEVIDAHITQFNSHSQSS